MSPNVTMSSKNQTSGTVAGGGTGNMNNHLTGLNHFSSLSGSHNAISNNIINEADEFNVIDEEKK